MYRSHYRTYEAGFLSELLDQNKQEIRSSIHRESEDYILNVNEIDYIQHLKSRYELNIPQLHFDQVFAETEERMIPAEDFPKRFNVYPGKKYAKTVIIYHIPFSGDILWLRFKPQTYIMRTIRFGIQDNCITLDFIQFNDNDVEPVRNEFESEKRALSDQLGSLQNDLKQWNQNLGNVIKQIFDDRKQTFLTRRNSLAQLGVPIKKKGQIPETFAIPTEQIRKKIEVKKPTVNEKGFKPDPTLDHETYMDILKVLFDLGREMERKPSIYKGKQEEDLRDLMLLYLEPRYEGSATGETFNKKGKTDILLRYEGSNAFVAECKFWKGPKNYLKTIDQLLGYLTWRDSKAAVIMFVDKKDFSDILGKVQSNTPNHSNYLGFVDQMGESWFNYRFHINGDRNKEVKLAVLLFHLPEE